MGDSIIHGEIPAGQLRTPPATITRDQHAFPTVDDAEHQQSNHLNGSNVKRKKQRNVALTGLSNAYEDQSLNVSERYLSDDVFPQAMFPQNTPK